MEEKLFVNGTIMETNLTYKMTLTEEQYNLIALCVETCHRISCGDVDELRQILPISPDRKLLDKIKQQSFPELSPNESYKWSGGYRNTSKGEPFRKSFDTFQAQGYQIYREMRYKQNIAKGIDNVLSDPTLTTHKANKPIIEITKNEKDT